MTETVRISEVLVSQSCPDRVQLKIRDNGAGISPENKKRLFSPGFTTRKHGHGYGLHSAILTAKEMKGTLTAESEGCGQGALFTLELPLTTIQGRG